MKLCLTTFFLLVSGFTQAAGHDCEAICLAVDSANSTVHVIGEMNLQAGVSRLETHRLLKRKCESQARHFGAALLVDTLDFSSSVDHESESYHVHTTRSYSGYYRQYEGRTLFMRSKPSSANIACQVDPDIQDGDIPYTGDLIIN
jgi:hypothetical protein